MLSLLRMEWRETRSLIIALVLLAPLLSLGLKDRVITWEKTTPWESVVYFIPVLLTLFVLGVGADLIAGDRSSGRTGFLAALPVRPWQIWAEKALFLLVTSIGYLLWLLIIEATVLTAAGEDAGLLVGRAGHEYSSVLAIVFLIAAATLFWSTLLSRGFAVVFATVLTAGGIIVLLSIVGIPAVISCHNRQVRFYENWWAEYSLAVTLCLAVALTGGSFVAFVRGRLHLRLRLRRFAWATVGVLMFLVPPSAYAAIKYIRWITVDPSDRDLVHWATGLSPDGRLARVHGLRGYGSGRTLESRPQATWCIRLEDGHVMDEAPVEWVTWLTGAEKRKAPGPTRHLLVIASESRDGVALTHARGHLFRERFDGSEPEEIAFEVPSTGISISPNAQRAIFWGGTPPWWNAVVFARPGADPVAFSRGRWGRCYPRILWAPDSKSVLVWDSDPQKPRILRFEGERVRMTLREDLPIHGFPTAFTGDAILVAVQDHHRLDLVTLDGEVRQLLPSR